MKRLLSIDDNLACVEELDLSNDRPSCRLFWATLLDYANTENAEEIGYCPADRENCITVLIDGQTYPVVPLPYEVQETFLRFAQEIALGQFWYTILVRLRNKPFTRERRLPLEVEVGNRRSKWRIRCTRDTIRFRRVA